MEPTENKTNIKAINPIDEPTVVPISIRLSGDPIITTDTALSVTITPALGGGSGTLQDGTIYDLKYYELIDVEDGDNPGQIKAVLQELTGTVAAGITQIPSVITQYGSAAGAVLQLCPTAIGTMQLVILAYPQDTDSGLPVGFAAVPINPPIIPE